MPPADRPAFEFRGKADRARTLYYIAAAVLAALVPLILFAGLWIRAVLNQNEHDLQTYLISRASSLSGQLDTEMQQQFSILKAIASVPSLDKPDLAAFHLTATRMVSSDPAMDIGEPDRPQRRQGGPEYAHRRSGPSFPRWATGTRSRGSPIAASRKSIAATQGKRAWPTGAPSFSTCP